MLIVMPMYVYIYDPDNVAFVERTNTGYPGTGFVDRMGAAYVSAAQLGCTEV